MESPRIVRLEPTDWELYRSLRLEALRESPDAFGSTYEAEAPQPDTHWQARLARAAPQTDLPVVAMLGDQPVGLAWARIEPYSELDSEVDGHLYQMWVSPKARGKGVGKALMEALVDWFRTAGAVEVELDVTRGNSPATKLYEHYGFRPHGEPKPLRPGSDLLVDRMRLGLGQG